MFGATAGARILGVKSRRERAQNQPQICTHETVYSDHIVLFPCVFTELYHDFLPEIDSQSSTFSAGKELRGPAQGPDYFKQLY